jgi:hypothetical protein
MHCVGLFRDYELSIDMPVLLYPVEAVEKMRGAG